MWNHNHSPFVYGLLSKLLDREFYFRTSKVNKKKTDQRHYFRDHTCKISLSMCCSMSTHLHHHSSSVWRLPWPPLPSPLLLSFSSHDRRQHRRGRRGGAQRGPSSAPLAPTLCKRASPAASTACRAASTSRSSRSARRRRESARRWCSCTGASTRPGAGLSTGFPSSRGPGSPATPSASARR